MAQDRIFQFDSIDKAPLLELDGETIVDLVSQPIFSGKLDAFDRIIIVDKKLAGKPHLISQIIYGSQNFVDLLFCFNGYSNPLTIKGGDILVIPPLDSMRKNIGRANIANDTISELNKRISEPDKNRIKFLSGSDMVKAPNMNEEKTQFIKKGRSVFLGEKTQPSVEAINITKEKLLKNIKNRVS